MRKQRQFSGEDTAPDLVPIVHQHDYPQSAGGSSEFTSDAEEEAAAVGDGRTNTTNAAISILESSPLWIQELADVNPFENQMPTLFPYELPTGLSVQGRRMSGSTIITTTSRTYSIQSDVSPKLRLAQIMEEHHLRPWLEQVHVRYLKEARRICRTPIHLANIRQYRPNNMGSEDLEDALCQLETNLSMLERLPTTSNNDGMSETMAQIHGEIAQLTMGTKPERARESLKEQIRLLLSPMKPKNIMRVADATIQLGDLEQNLGNFDKALHECYGREGYSKVYIYQQKYGQDHIAVGRLWVRQGRTLLNMANTTIMDHNPQNKQRQLATESLQCLEKGLDIVKANLGPDAKEVGDVLFLMGHAHLARGSKHAALERLWECLKVRKQQERQQQQQQQQQQQSSPLQQQQDSVDATLEVSETLRAIGMVHRFNGEAELAKGCYEDCERMLKELVVMQDNNSNGRQQERQQLEAELVRTFLCLGHLHCKSRQPDERKCARDIYEDALARATVLNDPVLLGEALSAMGDYYCLVDEEERGMACYEKVPSDSLVHHQHVLLIRGILHFQQGEAASAIACLREFVELRSARDEAYVVGMISLGVCHVAEGNKDQARASYKAALALGHSFEHDCVARECFPKFKQKVNKRGSLGRALFGKIKSAVRMNSIQE